MQSVSSDCVVAPPIRNAMGKFRLGRLRKYPNTKAIMHDKALKNSRWLPVCGFQHPVLSSFQCFVTCEKIVYFRRHIQSIEELQ